MGGRGRAVGIAIGWACLQALALSACGGKAQPEIPPAQTDTSTVFGSGTRLKAHSLDGGSGARALLDFYDTELNTTCQFVESASGQWHCLPTAQARAYLDADCREPAYVEFDQCSADPPLPGLLVSASSPECDALTRAYSLAEERTGSTLYSRTSEGCIPQTTTYESAWSLVLEPLTRFVQGSLSVFGAAGGLQASRVTGDDGAYRNFQLMADGQPCVEVMLRGERRCMPGLSAVEGRFYFDGASCESPLATRMLTDGQRCAGQRSSYVVQRTQENCVENDSLRTAIADVSEVYESEHAGQCLATSPDTVSDNVSFYHSGSALSAEHAPPMGIARVGTGALGLPCQTDREGTPLMAPDPHLLFPQIWQPESGRKCGSIPDLNGTLHCVPWSLAMPTIVAGSSGPFSDAGCTQLVTSAFRDTCSGESLPDPYFTETAKTRCGYALTHAYRAEPYSGPLYEQHDTACVPASPWKDHLYFVVGAEVDLASFPALTETTER